MKKLLLLTFFLGGLLFHHQALATNYFVDFSAAAGGDGLASSTSWNNLDAFTEVARTAGDMVFVRGGTSTTTEISDLTFTSSGERNNPLVISRDYDNIWGDDTNSAQTYTVTTASTTMEASASITDIAAGDWIYVVGDHTQTPATPTPFNKPYAYEVKSVAGTTLTLYFPYQGLSPGSGKTLRVMPDNPIWNVATGDFQWVFAGDDYWHVYGIHNKGTDAAGQFTLGTGDGIYFRDVIAEGNGTSDVGITALQASDIMTKVRVYNVVTGVQGLAGADLSYFYIDCNSVASARAILATSIIQGMAEATFVNCTNDWTDSSTGQSVYLRNVNGANVYNGVNSNIATRRIFIEDEDQTAGVNKYGDNMLSAFTGQLPIYQSTTTNPRVGGAAKPMYFDNTNVSTQAYGTSSKASAIQLFGFSSCVLVSGCGYPLYIGTTTTTIDVYFASASTAQWTANPTNEELWIEAEYYANTTNNWKTITKSTGTLNFTGSTAYANLTITIKPAKAGTVYLRAYYAKKKEAGKNNVFYMDVKPIITQ